MKGKVGTAFLLLSATVGGLGAATEPAPQAPSPPPPSVTAEAAAPPLAVKAFSIIQEVTLRCVGANGVFDFVEEGGDDLLFAIPIGFDGRGYKLPAQPPMDMRCRFIVPREGQLNEVQF